MKIEIVNDSSKNFINMCSRLIDCNNLKKKFEEINNFSYDIVIRIRPDMYLKDIPNFLDIKDNTIYSYEYNIFRTSSLWGIADQYFYCNNNIANLILTDKLITFINNFNNNCGYNEHIFYKYVKTFNYNIKIFYSSSLIYKFININLYTLLYMFYIKIYNPLCLLN